MQNSKGHRKIFLFTLFMMILELSFFLGMKYSDYKRKKAWKSYLEQTHQQPFHKKKAPMNILC